MHQKEPAQRTEALARVCAGAPDWRVAVEWENVALGWYQFSGLFACLLTLSHTQEILLSHFPAQSAN